MAYAQYYYDPSESNAAYDENTLAGCVGGGEGYEKVDSYETNSVYLAIAIPNGAIVTSVAVSFQYKQLTWQNAGGLFYSSKLNWCPVLLKNPSLSGSKITALGTVTTLASKLQIASGIGAKNSYTSKSLSATMNTTLPISETNLVGVQFEIDSDNASDVHFYFKAVNITVTYTVPTYKVSTAVSPSGTGEVTGGGTYNYGTSVTLTATPKTGYNFVKWNDGVTTASRTVTVTGAVTYTAYFELDTINNIPIDTEKPKNILIDNDVVKGILIDNTKVYG